MLPGTVHTVDGGSAAGAWVVAEGDAGRDSARVGPDGRFVLPLPTPLAGGRLLLRLDAPGRYHPVRAALPADSLPPSLGVVLVPTRWTIPAGRHAGREVEIDLAAAHRPACPGCSGFYRAPAGRDLAGRETPPQSWPGTALPLRVAFERATAGGLSSRDSAAFWVAADALEEELGMDLFRPARWAETLPGPRGAPEDVVLVVLDPALRSVGWGSSVAQQGDIVYGAVRMRDGDVFRSPDGPRLVKHELVHALGYGHTCAWRSLMAQGPGCPRLRADAATAEDAAHIQVLQRARELQRGHPGAVGVESALP